MVTKNNYFPAVFYATLKLLMALIYAFPHNKNYIMNVLYYLDILGNALLGGNPEVTISARAGWLGSKGVGAWGFCEKWINWAFKPVDGPDHCWKAYLWTEKKFPKESIHKGPDLSGYLLAVLCVPVCILIALFTNLIKLFRAL